MPTKYQWTYNRRTKINRCTDLGNGILVGAVKRTRHCYLWKVQPAGVNPNDFTPPLAGAMKSLIGAKRSTERRYDELLSRLRSPLIRLLEVQAVNVTTLWNEGIERYGRPTE